MENVLQPETPNSERNFYKPSNLLTHMIGKLTCTFMVILLSSLSAFQPMSAYITVDRGCGATYYQGESILVTYIVEAATTDTVLVTIKEILPDSTLKVLLSNKPTEPGLMYTMRLLAPPLYGKGTLIMEYIVKSPLKSSWHATECSFYIKEGITETGSLRIECTQSGFDIFIDDAFVAHSETESVLVEGISGGGHTVTIKKAGCKDYTAPVTIAAGQTVTVKVELDCTIRDKDGDGVPDEKDDCTNPLCGLVDASGCPLDGDGDGVNDCEDICPGEKGDRESRGCPYGDSDSDGVPDNLDQCTSECVIVDEKGCPKDSDSDGISDCEDDCPQEKGDKEHFGCPERDSDSDGVLDGEDRCYNPDCTWVDELGCPQDSDADTIPDCIDECPDTAGIREKNGCPESEAGGNGGLLVICGFVLAWVLTRAHRL